MTRPLTKWPMPALVSGEAEKPPPHPYWCDDCGGKAAFTMPGCEVDHDELCPRYGEDAMQVYRAAVEYVTRTGKTIP